MRHCSSQLQYTWRRVFASCTVVWTVLEVRVSVGATGTGKCDSKTTLEVYRSDASSLLDSTARVDADPAWHMPRWFGFIPAASDGSNFATLQICKHNNNHNHGDTNMHVYA